MVELMKHYECRVTNYSSFVYIFGEHTRCDS